MHRTGLRAALVVCVLVEGHSYSFGSLQPVISGSCSHETVPKL